MPLRYKVNCLELLKEKGYNTNYIKINNIFGQGTLQKFRRGEIVGPDNLERLCELLELQPGDIIEYVPGDNTGDEK